MVQCDDATAMAWAYGSFPLAFCDCFYAWKIVVDGHEHIVSSSITSRPLTALFLHALYTGSSCFFNDIKL